MAKARADIVCECCGKTFSVEKIVRNTDAKKIYEEWALKNITVCPACYKKQEVESAVESGDAVVKRMLYKDYKNEWAMCKTVPDTYDRETKTIDVIVSKRDRAWHDAWEIIPDKMKNDEFFAWRWKSWLFDELLKHMPVEPPEDAPEWLVEVAKIINGIYA